MWWFPESVVVGLLLVSSMRHNVLEGYEKPPIFSANRGVAATVEKRDSAIPHATFGPKKRKAQGRRGGGPLKRVLTRLGKFEDRLLCWCTEYPSMVPVPPHLLLERLDRRASLQHDVPLLRQIRDHSEAPHSAREPALAVPHASRVGDDHTEGLPIHDASDADVDERVVGCLEVGLLAAHEVPARLLAADYVVAQAGGAVYDDDDRPVVVLGAGPAV